MNNGFDFIDNFIVRQFRTPLWYFIRLDFLSLDTSLATSLGTIILHRGTIEINFHYLVCMVFVSISSSIV